MSLTANMTRCRPSVLGGGVLRLGAGRRRRVELRQLQLAVPVRGPHHGDITTHAVESDGAVRPASLDLRLALQLKSELGEERDGGIQIVDDDAHVVHSFDYDGSPFFLARPDVATGVPGT